MKYVYRLFNHQYLAMLRLNLILYLVLIVLQVFSFQRNLTGKDFTRIRFEQIMYISGFGTMFLIFYILVLGVVVFSIYRLYFGSKSIYTVLSLPVEKSVIYFGFLLSGVLSLLFLCFCQVLSVIVCYLLLVGKVHGSYMSDALFLSFYRLNTLRYILPLSYPDMVKSLIMLFSPVAAVLHAVFSERSRKYSGFAPVFVWLLCFWQMVTSYNSSGWYIYSLIVVVTGITVRFSVLSVRYIKYKLIV